MLGQTGYICFMAYLFVSHPTHPYFLQITLPVIPYDPSLMLFDITHLLADLTVSNRILINPFWCF